MLTPLLLMPRHCIGTDTTGAAVNLGIIPSVSEAPSPPRSGGIEARLLANALAATLATQRRPLLRRRCQCSSCLPPNDTAA